MRSVLALMRAAWLSATSYRLAMVFSFTGLIASVVPLYFVAHAVQPLAGASIALEGGDYFGFVVTGVAATYVVASAATAIPTALMGSIGSGTFEALLVTRTPLPLLLAGMSGYGVVQATLRAGVLMLGALALGVRIHPGALPWTVLLVALTIAAYAAFGLMAGALILVFRTAGPLLTAVVTGSGLLGGVYYSTTVIPGWLQSLSSVVPLTYGLRATRRLLLGGASLGDVVGDIGILTFLAAAGLATGAVAFALALRHARRAGTLAQY